MPILTVEESNYAGIIPEDTILPARVTAVAQKKKPFQDEGGNDIWKMEFTFTIEDPESPWDGSRLWGETSINLTNHPDCKLRAWAQELLGAELEAGYQLDTDHLVNQPCRVVVGIKPYTDKTTKQDKERNIVRDVMRPREAAIAYAAPAAQAPVYRDEEPF